MIGGVSITIKERLRNDFLSTSFPSPRFQSLAHMRFHYGRVALTFLLVGPFSRAFSITGLTPTVTLGQVEQLTWFRDANNDPTVFQLAKGSGLRWNTIGPAVSVQNQKTQGTVPVTFDDALSQVSIAAYDPSSSSFQLLFNDPNPITILVTQPLAQTPPSTDPQTTAPGITMVATSTTSVPPPSKPVHPIPTGLSPESTGSSSPITTSGGALAPMSAVSMGAITSQGSSMTPSGDNNTFPTTTIDSVATGGNKNPISPSAGSAPSDALQSHSHPNVGVVAGGVVGGVLTMLVIATFVIYILKRRKKKMNYTLDQTPYLDTSGSDASDMDIRERKMQLLGQREHLERELEAYEQASQNLSSGTGAVPDGINGSNQDDIAQVLRRMEVLTQRIATLEEGMAPPDYSSGTA
ncbi:hypothetical protein E1B28_013001 [Marasmius oreades]|uniref:Uncharacterized protein n=1 Tax=Marasmius oreades TaxID=181124 RepID=A0A9P7RPD5_9AGAR|nr:uncharacterized protein E1B28_013001 [Marasmius oreades]KAG7087022.1 hypothetical protein E1B28_013001 [Marasmius oreades]